jgi:tetratricopeptide (TPR) repeat protein
MLEKHINRMSSEGVGIVKNSNMPINSSNHSMEGNAPPKVYLASDEAIRDFENEKTSDLQFQIENKNKKIINEKIECYLTNAKLLIKHGDYKLALNLLREASNRNSHNPDTLKLLAQCLDNVGRSNESLVAFKALVKLDNCFENLSGLASVHYKLGHDQEALDKYFEALSVLNSENEQLFDVYKNMGNIFVRRGDFEAAEEYYNKAYTLNTQSDVLLINFGTLEVQRSDFDKALYCFRKAVEINPQSDKAWVGLAMVHSQLSDVELAWANLDCALEINPKNRTAVHLAANWGHRDNKLDKAILALQNLLGCVEEDEDMSLVLINLLCLQGKFDLAQMEIERVLAWNPDHQEVRALRKKLFKIQKGA